VYELLEDQGFEVNLVDARHVKNVTGRKSDVEDCQWIQQLHTYGLLNSAFRPSEDVCALRSYIRQRSMLIQDSSRQILHLKHPLVFIQSIFTDKKFHFHTKLNISMVIFRVIKSSWNFFISFLSVSSAIFGISSYNMTP